jgi:hypothetical protein
MLCAWNELDINAILMEPNGNDTEFKKCNTHFCLGTHYMQVACLCKVFFL